MPAATTGAATRAESIAMQEDLERSMAAGAIGLSTGLAMPALASAADAGVLISLATPANTVADEEALEILAAERRAMEMHVEG